MAGGWWAGGGGWGREVGGMGGGRCDESLLVGQFGDDDVSGLEGRLLPPNDGPEINIF